MNRIYKSPIANYRLLTLKILCVLCVLCCSIYSVKGQSTNQSFPTAITTNEISGKIPARDIGDARLTSYFYTFNAAQGDVFINVVTTNLNGDIDVFTADNLRPLTKITIYADTSSNETGRVIYLRQPTKLILRIEGRSPNDDAATFRIKFAGSFAPAEPVAENPESETPIVKSDNQTDIRVNSVGTIIEVKPKPTPKPKEIIAEVKPVEKTETPVTEKPITPAQETTVVSIEKTETSETKSEKKEADTIITITDENKRAEEKVEVEKEGKTTITISNEEVETEKSDTVVEVKIDTPEQTQPIEETNVVKKETEITEKPKESNKSNPVKSLPPSALENIRLVVLFKNGSKIERPMSEILKVGVDKGILTVVAKDGAIGRYSILDVEKMTIE